MNNDQTAELVVFRVTAVDEFGRKFGAQEVVPQQNIHLAYFRWHNMAFEKLVRDVLRHMGEAARATWVGATEVLDLRRLQQHDDGDRNV